MQHIPLSQAIPDWVIQHTQSRVCSQCGKQYTRSEIKAFGVRESDDKHCNLYVEHCCSHCNRPSVTVFKGDHDASIEDVCYSLLEHLRQQQIRRKSRHVENQNVRKKQTPISEDEICDFMQFIKKPHTHDDFMRKIGVPIPKLPAQRHSRKHKNDS